MSASPVPDDRQPVDVAVGVLLRPDGHFLLTSRPAGKVFAGHWEFPGGKFEMGEDVHAALARELSEELGIEVRQSQFWRLETMSYPHAKVRLHFCKVTAWAGEPAPHEGQQLAWQDLPTTVGPLLAGTVPVLAWLADERSAKANPDWLDQVRFDAQGLVPVIAQEQSSRDVLMVAWMNRESLRLTVATGEAHYWSRSRRKLWHKGEESGHVQTVHDVRLDCDGDVILLTVTQHGHEPSIACHTGRHACFYQRLEQGRWVAVEPVLKAPEAIYASPPRSEPA